MTGVLILVLFSLAFLQATFPVLTLTDVFAVGALGVKSPVPDAGRLSTDTSDFLVGWWQHGMAFVRRGHCEDPLPGCWFRQVRGDGRRGQLATCTLYLTLTAFTTAIDSVFALLLTSARCTVHLPSMDAWHKWTGFPPTPCPVPHHSFCAEAVGVLTLGVKALLPATM